MPLSGCDVRESHSCESDTLLHGVIKFLTILSIFRFWRNVLKGMAMALAKEMQCFGCGCWKLNVSTCGQRGVTLGNRAAMNADTKTSKDLNKS